MVAWWESIMTIGVNAIDERERVLAAIRNGAPATAQSPADRTTYAAILPPVPADWDGMLALFAKRCAALRAELIVVRDAAEMIARVQPILQESGQRVAYQPQALVRQVIEAYGGQTLAVEEGYDAKILEGCGVGVTGCLALVAQTGSVMITARQSGGRTLSILPPHHIVLATAGDLVADLPAAFARFAEEQRREPTSMVSLISGPSRTGDIERILVLGAHGPKRLTIILATAGMQG
jgi:L-lactate dehydrogenase complex protein LldG